MPRISIPTLPPRPPGPLSALSQLPLPEAAAHLADFLRNGKGNTLVLTGAGVSVDSGIRAYRGKDGHYSNPNYTPILYHELVEKTKRGELFRKRYWARSFLVREAKPNPNHIYVAALQALGLAPNLITQNVDNLHPKAFNLVVSQLPQSHPFRGYEPTVPLLTKLSGDKLSQKKEGDTKSAASHRSPPQQQPRILELHGTLAKVHCLDHLHEQPRDDYQQELADSNPIWEEQAQEAERTGVRPRTNPDGDVELSGVDFSSFVVPPCKVCASSTRSSSASASSSAGTTNVSSTTSVVKPNVVFFGETLRPQVRDSSLALVENCENLLVLGTSLATFSAFRLIKLARERGKDVLLISAGPTRADDLEGVVKMERKAGDVLKQYLDELLKVTDADKRKSRSSSGVEVDAVRKVMDMGVVVPPPEVEGPRAEG